MYTRKKIQLYIAYFQKLWPMQSFPTLTSRKKNIKYGTQANKHRSERTLFERLSMSLVWDEVGWVRTIPNFWDMMSLFSIWLKG